MMFLLIFLLNLKKVVLLILIFYVINILNLMPFKICTNKIKADYIAMGHYARINYNKSTNKYELLKGIDDNKDQSYFLCQLNQEQLKYSLFPLGNKTKVEVRQLALSYNLPTATKKIQLEFALLVIVIFKIF